MLVAPDDAPWVIAGLAFIVVALGVVSYLLDMSALDAWTGTMVFMALVLGSIPVLRWVSRKDGDPWLFKVLMVALVVHLLASLVRYFVIFVVYKGSADAGVYHEAGVTFARNFRDGEPLHPIPIISGFPAESKRIADFIGVIYVITGPSVYAGFFIFSYICFWGQLLVVRAFRAAVPEGDHRRFTILCMFLPSLLFWPSSIGKEALMIGCLGVAVYGGGLLLGPRPKLRGGLFFIIGTLLILSIRTHVAVMSLISLALALAVGVIWGFQTGEADTDPPDVVDSTDADGDGDATTESDVIHQAGRGRAVRLIGIIVIILLAGTASTRLSQQFDQFSASSDGASASLDKTLAQTSIGNSEFSPVSITGPSRVVPGIVSVLFRPFPWEARNFNSLIAGAESALLIVLLVVGWRRLVSLPQLILRRPFLVFCGVYILLFSIGFSFIGNFGILARQRVQVMPVVLVLLALQVSASRGSERDESPIISAVEERHDADSVGGMLGSPVGRR